MRYLFVLVTLCSILWTSCVDGTPLNGEANHESIVAKDDPTERTAMLQLIRRLIAERQVEEAEVDISEKSPRREACSLPKDCKRDQDADGEQLTDEQETRADEPSPLHLELDEVATEEEQVARGEEPSQQQIEEDVIRDEASSLQTSGIKVQSDGLVRGEGGYHGGPGGAPKADGLARGEGGKNDGSVGGKPKADGGSLAEQTVRDEGNLLSKDLEVGSDDATRGDQNLDDLVAKLRNFVERLETFEGWTK